MANQLQFEHFDQLVSQIKTLAEASFKEGKPMDQVEGSLYSQLRKMGLALLTAVLDAAEQGDVGPTIEKNSRTYKRLPKRSRRYRSIFGDIRFERYVYGTAPSDAIQAIPLDEHFGLPEHDYSLLLESWTGMHATDASFGRAVKKLEAILEIHIPIDSAERIEERLGKSAALVLENLPPIDRDTEAEILVQTSDNKGIPMVRSAVKSLPVGAPEERKGPAPDKKQMACMAGVYTIAQDMRTPQQIIDALFRVPYQRDDDYIEALPQNPRYFASMTRYDRNGEILGKTAEQQAQQWMTFQTIRRCNKGQLKVVMHDGQKSLWNCAEDFQEGWQTIDILDLLHVLPRIWSSAKIIKPKAEVEDFVKEQLLLLLTGSIGLLIGPLKDYRRCKGVKKKDKEELTRIINYLEANKCRMKYNEYLATGLPIATGFIEGACRHVIKDRMECSGMRWKEHGARTMLNLRCIAASELWDVTIEQHRELSLAKYGKERKNYFESFLSMAA